VLSDLSAAEVTAVLHCFSGTAESARALVSAGMYLSFAGNLTYKNAEALRDAARVVPLDRVLVETDSPVLAPQVWRGRRNEPAYVTEILRTLAGMHALSVRDLDSHITATADRIFRWREA
jgi:TatD DNase family protein